MDVRYACQLSVNVQNSGTHSNFCRSLKIRQVLDLFERRLRLDASVFDFLKM